MVSRGELYLPLAGEGGQGRAASLAPVRVVAVAAACLTALAAAFVAGRHSSPLAVEPPAPTAKALQAFAKETALYTPNIMPVFAGEPLAKATVRRFDFYLMNQATYDDPTKKLTNVEQWLAPNFIYESVGFPSSKTPSGWCLGGEEQQFRTAFPTSAFTQMLFFGTDGMATTTSYGNVLWEAELFGIPAPKQWVYFRVTDFYNVTVNSLGQTQLYYNFMMIDFADLFRQVGRPLLPKAPLPEGVVLPPSVNDGVPAPLSVVAWRRDAKAAAAAADRALHQDWAGEAFNAEGWHADFTFYGPGGIGMARNAREYEAHVLAPFRAAFKGRVIDVQISGCEGNYCGSFGAIKGKHIAPWLGLEASGRMVALRFAMHWRIIDGRAAEGWAIFDIPGLFAQLGRDFFRLAVMAREASP